MIEHLAPIILTFGYTCFLIAMIACFYSNFNFFHFIENLKIFDFCNKKDSYKDDIKYSNSIGHTHDIMSISYPMPGYDINSIRLTKDFKNIHILKGISNYSNGEIITMNIPDNYLDHKLLIYTIKKGILKIYLVHKDFNQGDFKEMFENPFKDVNKLQSFTTRYLYLDINECKIVQNNPFKI